MMVFVARPESSKGVLKLHTPFEDSGRATNTSQPEVDCSRANSMKGNCMFPKTSLGLTLGCSVLWMAGCGSQNGVPAKANPPVSADAVRVTLHVPGMVERLKLA